MQALAVVKQTEFVSSVASEKCTNETDERLRLWQRISICPFLRRNFVNQEFCPMKFQELNFMFLAKTLRKEKSGRIAEKMEGKIFLVRILEAR